MPHFVEPDLNGDASTPITFLRPAVVLDPATRYVVAFRNLQLAVPGTYLRSGFFFL